MEAFGDSLNCPWTPLDNVTEASDDIDASWTNTCENYNDYKDYSTNEIKKNQNQKPKEETFKLKNVLGAGINRGLSVIVDTLECGWHSTSLFDGVKVY